MGLKFNTNVLGWINSPKNWKKATKFFKLINLVRDHIRIQKKRVQSVVINSRTDIAEILKCNRLMMNQVVLDRVVQLYRYQKRVLAYNQIDELCVCIINNFSQVKTSSSGMWLLLSIEVREAVSSLVFAASRCGELPVLNFIRVLLVERFGSEFESISVKLKPGNHVNMEMKENLCAKSVPEEVKKTLIADIAIDNGVSEQRAEVANDLDCEEQLKENDCRVLVTCDAGSVMETARPSFVHPRLPEYEDVVLELECRGRKLGENDCRVLSIMETARPSFVHPRLPEYEDVVLELECRRRKLGENDCRVLVTCDGSVQMETARPSFVHPRLPEYEDVVLELECFRRKLGENDCRMLVSYDTETTRSSFVHPRLPEYEDVIAEVADLKTRMLERL